MTAPDTARAHVWQGRPGCVACGGLGTIHQQVPGELRVVRVTCACVTEQQFAHVRDERLARLQRDVP